ncbi:nickel-responsive transcriptional regulator NikR [Candidatus Bathyarchaeota archaeon]|nr:nickel-responsive transcriptional regulator NikR [Candidatus Bathyarchaeota archaeon]
MSEGVSRISISIPPDLLRKFDEAQKRLGYTERSKAVQTAMQNFITESKWLCNKKGRGIGAIVMVYDSTVRQAGDALTEIEHKYRSIAESVIHLHLDDKNCLQIIPVRGDAVEVRILAEALMTAEGVKEVKLAIVTP